MGGVARGGGGGGAGGGGGLRGGGLLARAVLVTRTTWPMLMSRRRLSWRRGRWPALQRALARAELVEGGAGRGRSVTGRVGDPLRPSPFSQPLRRSSKLHPQIINSEGVCVCVCVCKREIFGCEEPV